MSLFIGENVYPRIAQFTPLGSTTSAPGVPLGATEGGMWYDNNAKLFKGLINGVATALGGNPGTANLVDPTQSPYNVKADVKQGVDGTTSNTSNLFSSAAQSCITTDIGKLAIVINAGNGVYPFGTGLVTVTACSGSSWVLSTNATSSIAGFATWAIGSAGNSAALQTAYVAAIQANKILALPCGPMILDGFPNLVTPATMQYLVQKPHIQGCNSTAGTTLILHPASITTANPGRVIAWNQNGQTGFTIGGLPSDASIEHLFITSMNGALPCNSGQVLVFIDGFTQVTGIHVNALAFNNSCTVEIINSSFNELNATHIDLQGFSGSAAYIGVTAQGQGVFAVHDSIFAQPAPFGSPTFTAMQVGGASQTFATMSNCYLVQVTTGISAAGGSGTSVTITGSEFNQVTTPITDNGNATLFYVFGNPLINTTGGANFLFKLTNAATVMDISGSFMSAGGSQSIASGAGIINDRAGNTWPTGANGFTASFTGKYIPVGGGSMATQQVSAATNFGSNLTAQTVVPNIVAKSVINVMIGARQVTAGVGCGAGSNTVLATLSFTAPSGTVTTLNTTTLSISANGAVDSGAAAEQTFAIPAAVNTAITYTTTSTLASTGCTTTPQYIVEAAVS